ncbi:MULTISPECIES: hypothetical protein [Sorangium]|uniref:Secreted protein n=1 Tax=Sorangium cellulosum TaxID=56 RepID=A0A4P2QLV6_SORCE|nr:MULTISPECIES: hypothetical protein [Sorangium]AUX30761.1 uncharacterized protein SOCE836_028720 [Sorangium cellulosum]WCQ90140.1 hypothetical protein NQZ70_02841 [Sorangium sp. Soce836]
MKGAKIAMAGLGAALALATGAALAQPTSCDVGAGRRNYEAAKNKQLRYLEDLFKTAYGCRGYEDFSESMHDMAAHLSIQDPCEARGTRDAIFETLDKVRNQCVGGGAEDAEFAAVGECTRSGQDAGAVAAKMFCGAGFGERPAFPTMCDVIAAQACRDRFEQYVIEKCPDLREKYGEHYKRFLESACTIQH